MTNALPFSIGFFFLFLTACVSNELQKAASEAAISVHAANYKIGKGTSIGEEDGTFRSLNLTLSNIDHLGNAIDDNRLLAKVMTN